MNILFIGNSRLGDAVISTGLLNHFNNKDNRITVVCSSISIKVYEAFPSVKKTIVIKKKKYSRHWLDVLINLENIVWDVIIDLRNTIITRILRKRKIFRYFNNNNCLHKVQELSQVINSKIILTPKIYTNYKNRKEAKSFIDPIKNEKILAIAPITNWQRKNWPSAYFEELVNKIILNKKNFKISSVIILGSKSEYNKCQELKSKLNFKSYNLAGVFEILTIFEILKACEVFIGNDSGLSHLAAASGIKTLALFGPSKENKYKPWGENCSYIRTPQSYEELVDNPGYNRFDKVSLMRSLSVESVYEKFKKILLK